MKVWVNKFRNQPEFHIKAQININTGDIGYNANLKEVFSEEQQNAEIWQLSMTFEREDQTEVSQVINCLLDGSCRLALILVVFALSS